MLLPGTAFTRLPKSQVIANLDSLGPWPSNESANLVGGAVGVGEVGVGVQFAEGGCPKAEGN